MMNLAKYRHSNARLADFLPWAALVDEGIILNKDGSFQRTAKFRGPDLDSAVPAELVAVAGRLNNALRRLGSGWAVFVEAQRHSAGAYPPNTFPDVASALVDAERRAQFEEAGAHYESSYFLTFLYLPIVILVIYSFNDSKLVSVWGGWSLRWYRELWNDTAMLEWAGVGVAMDTAPDQVKAYADTITSGVPGDGVADVLDALQF